MSRAQVKLSPKANKYGARRVTVDGYTFHSQREANRYRELRLLVRAKLIHDLRLQVPFSVEINGRHVCAWRADFVYWQDGQEIIEDSKGYRTRLYRLKKRLIEAVYGFEIKET